MSDYHTDCEKQDYILRLIDTIIIFIIINIRLKIEKLVQIYNILLLYNCLRYKEICYDVLEMVNA